jgi:hypothetical protein
VYTRRAGSGELAQVRQEDDGFEVGMDMVDGGSALLGREETLCRACGMECGMCGVRRLGRRGLSPSLALPKMDRPRASEVTEEAVRAKRSERARNWVGGKQSRGSAHSRSHSSLGGRFGFTSSHIFTSIRLSRAATASIFTAFHANLPLVVTSGDG